MTTLSPTATWSNSHGSPASRARSRSRARRRRNRGRRSPRSSARPGRREKNIAYGIAEPYSFETWSRDFQPTWNSALPGRGVRRPEAHRHRARHLAVDHPADGAAWSCRCTARARSGTARPAARRVCALPGTGWPARRRSGVRVIACSRSRVRWSTYPVTAISRLAWKPFTAPSVTGRSRRDVRRSTTRSAAAGPGGRAPGHRGPPRRAGSGRRAAPASARAGLRAGRRACSVRGVPSAVARPGSGRSRGGGRSWLSWASAARGSPRGELGARLADAVRERERAQQQREDHRTDRRLLHLASHPSHGSLFVMPSPA